MSGLANGWQQHLWRTKGPPLRGGEEKTRGGRETDIEKISLRVDFVFFVQPLDLVFNYKKMMPTNKTQVMRLL